MEHANQNLGYNLQVYAGASGDVYLALADLHEPRRHPRHRAIAQTASNVGGMATSRAASVIMSSFESILITWVGLGGSGDGELLDKYKTKGCGRWQKDDGKEIS